MFLYAHMHTLLRILDFLRNAEWNINCWSKQFGNTLEKLHTDIAVVFRVPDHGVKGWIETFKSSSRR